MRVIRATSAIGPSENAMTGMIRCFGSPQPPVGNSPSRIDEDVMSRYPMM